MKRTTSIDSFFKAWRSNCLPGLFFVLFMLSCSMVAFSQPTYSRGEQQLAITYEFAMNRAKAALIAEGYVNLNQGGAFISGYKGINTAIIMCNVAPDAKTWVNIVVASNATDSNIPGAERVKLQKRMDQNLSGSSLVGEWFLKCCNDELQWTLHIKNQNGSDFSGSFNDVNGGGNITNGKINGNNIEFVRSGNWGSQKWTAQLTTVGGQQRMVNGVWTGDYLDAYKGKNNWHAEMDQNLSGSNLVGEWFLKCCNDELQWTLYIKNQNGSDFSGSFNDVNGGGNISNGKINGNNIEFVRSGNWGSQKWTAQLTTVGGQQRIVNGVWTGDYLDAYKGKNNWHAEKK